MPLMTWDGVPIREVGSLPSSTDPRHMTRRELLDLVLPIAVTAELEG
jgi:hypothetical protein